MKLGKSIKSIREKKKIRQYILAGKAGISATYLSQIENDWKIPDQVIIAAICAALEIPQPLLHLYSMEESDVPEKRKEQYRVAFPIVERILLQLLT